MQLKKRQNVNTISKPSEWLETNRLMAGCYNRHRCNTRRYHELPPYAERVALVAKTGRNNIINNEQFDLA
jgi:hypothetical protein